MVVRDRAAAHTNSADEHAILIDDGYTARKGDQAVVGMLDAVKRLGGLRQLPELAGGHAEEAGGLGLLDGNIDGAYSCVVTRNEGLGVGFGISDGVVHQRRLGAELV